MNLAPVAEFLTGENGAFLGDRSYGGDPVFAGRAAAAFIRGMEGAGVACVVKHFPGNGGVDPHEAPVSLPYGPEELERLASPFRTVLEKTPPAGVMVSHALVPALDPGRMASLSVRIIGGWLREELDFDGIVVADDFSMGAVRSQGLSSADAVIEALNAGVDMVMAWPPQITLIHRAILDALDGGKLSRERLEEAAGRILYAKFKLGLMERERFFYE
jgi:beta-N-acetylhexosaminidase